MNAAVVFMEYGAIATLAVLAFFVILQLILTPRRMESALRGLRPEASEIRAQLDRYIQQGIVISRGAERMADPATLDDLENKISEWVTAVCHYLDDEQQTGLAGQFLNDSAPLTQFSIRGRERWSGLTNFLGLRLYQLGEIIKRY
jgi:hypothetical protein